MWGSSDFNIMLVLRCADEVQGLDKKQSAHQMMDVVREGPVLDEADVDPYPDEDNVRRRKKGVDGGKA